MVKGLQLERTAPDGGRAGIEPKGTRTVMETVMNGIEKHAEYYPHTCRTIAA